MINRVLICLLFIGRKGGVGCYALRGQAPEKTFNDGVKRIKGKGSFPETAIRPTGWS